MLSAAAEITSSQDEHRSTSRAVAIALSLGIIYCGFVAVEPYIVDAIVGTVILPRTALMDHAGRIAVALTIVRWTALVLLVIGCAVDRSGVLRESLRNRRGAHWLLGVSAGALIALAVNVTGLWPFAWRWQLDANVTLARALSSSSFGIPLVCWFGAFSIAVPIVEEVVFRFGVLRYLVSRFGATVGVIGSSLAFGALHLGYPWWAPDAAHLRNSIGAAAFGGFLAILTLNRSGLIGPAIAVHAGANLMSEATLMLVVLEPGLS